jgi:hypothetical protein
MSPQQFKTRFLASLPELPPDLPELRQQLSEFVQFPSAIVERLNISSSDKAILSGSGLPRDASPFLSFGLSHGRLLQPLNNVERQADCDRRYKMIGHNSSGDMICLDEDDEGSVVYLNHDNNMQVVFINSNVTALAECLCIFAESIKRNDPKRCREEIRRIDPTALRDGSFWPFEIDQME